MKEENKKNIEVSFMGSDVPIDYQWSGYTKSAEEFKGNNFLEVNVNSKTVYICASENGVALGDYLSKYIFKKPYIIDMESVLSPGYDYWFFQAWEMSDPYYDDLDDWIKDIVEMLINQGYIAKVKKEDVMYFLFSELSDFENQPIPDEVSNKAESICRARLLQYFESTLSDYGDLNEVSLGDGGKWARSIFEEFVQLHPECTNEEDEEGERL